MSIPKRANRDYGYQPNMAEGVVDMESRVTTSGMGMAGKVEKHSEFMNPNNQPYDEMEYIYPDYGSGNDPWNNSQMNPLNIGPGRGWPGNPTDCKILWNKLFPKHPLNTGSFIPDAHDRSSLNQYVKAGCPVDYIPVFCCPDVKISGPKEVDGESITDYSIVNPKVNCDYTWESSAGRIPGGTFYAPVGPTTVTIKVKPFMGDDMGKSCAEIKVKVRAAGCSGETISVPSTQMQVSTSQTLTIVGSVPGKTYTWNISSGGGTMAGNVYTAPATNANCTSNPTIQLMVGSSVCASVTLAVNEYSDLVPSVRTWSQTSAVVPDGWVADGLCAKLGVLFERCAANETVIYCNGSVATGPTYTEFSVGFSDPEVTCSYCTSAHITPRTSISPQDLRTAPMKAAGCCPSQLL